MKGGAEVHDEDKRRENTESADKSFQARLLAAENLFMRHTEASFPLLIVADRPE
jgi:hypothetical protein